MKEKGRTFAADTKIITQKQTMMKKVFLMFTAMAFAAIAFAANAQLTKDDGEEPVIESIDKDWDRVTFPDLGLTFEAPSGLKPDPDFGRFNLRARSKGVFVDIVYRDGLKVTEATAAEYLESYMESTRKYTKESTTEIKKNVATSWEHKNGMQHHTRYIVRDGRYAKLIFYYFDDHKATLDKAAKRVLKTMKLNDPTK